MKNYKSVKITRDDLESITCDFCKKTYKKENFIEFQEFSEILYVGGYGSVIGDGVVVSVDICQHCLLKLIEDNNLQDWNERISQEGKK